MLKRIGRSQAARRLAGEAMAAYLTLVWRTGSQVYEDAAYATRLASDRPLIVALWHGQHFMVPFARPEGWDVRVMISRSGDGEINAVAAKRLGMGLIRASGGQTAAQIKKRGGARGFLEMLRALRDGANVSMTADVPKGPARVVGDGIVALAERSGRGILPVALANSRRFDINSWDKATIPLPFGRTAIVIGDVIAPPGGEEDREVVRAAIRDGLNSVTARAYALADRPRAYALADRRDG